MDFSYWAIGAPSNSPTDPLCGEMYSNGYWHDSQCTKYKRFGCKTQRMHEVGIAVMCNTLQVNFFFSIVLALTFLIVQLTPIMLIKLTNWKSAVTHRLLKPCAGTYGSGVTPLVLFFRDDAINFRPKCFWGYFSKIF